MYEKINTDTRYTKHQMNNLVFPHIIVNMILNGIITFEKFNSIFVRCAHTKARGLRNKFLW